MTISVKKLSSLARIPVKANKDDAGFDLYSTEKVLVQSFSRAVVSTGIAIEIPKGYAGFIQPRSGLAAKRGITVLNTPGLIDSGYRGEIKVILYNSTGSPFTVNVSDRIAQLVFVLLGAFELVEEKLLSQSERGEGGLGSTGINYNTGVDEFR